MDIFLVVIFGLVIGSFLNVCICRIANEESIAFPPSHCTNCGYELKAKDLIPVLSYIFLGGKCRSCKEKISIQYPIVEILNAILYVAIYLKFGFTLNLFKFCLLASLLIVIGFIDFKTKYVYNSTVVFGVVSGILFAALEWIETKSIPWNYVAGAFIGFGIIYLIVVLTRGMGEGDIDIALICGLFLGIKGILVTLFLAIILGGIVATIILIFKLKERKAEIAFGPYLAIGGIIACLYGSRLIDIYLGLF
ncbi:MULTISPECIES: prepilin peptidase [Clostridium]|uniref:prepilin peptidase n=1 Tax=Clostridium TaxID=1485 RepID=UPI000820D8D9|nr:A24 family peptidase [Clostridium saudiense]MDU7453256.1 prepilin peptidase [Clostridium saudiense]SCJ78940.1 Pectic enzymes secretion protein outO [uncultured Clostridium sp.]